MIPELKWLYSPDVDIESFDPEDGDAWGFLLQIGVAPLGVDGADSFDVIVCSPSWIALHYGADSVVDGRYHLLMPNYSKLMLDGYIARWLRDAAASTWDEVVDKLGHSARFSS